MTYHIGNVENLIVALSKCIITVKKRPKMRLYWESYDCFTFQTSTLFGQNKRPNLLILSIFSIWQFCDGTSAGHCTCSPSFPFPSLGFLHCILCYHRYVQYWNEVWNLWGSRRGLPEYKCDLFQFISRVGCSPLLSGQNKAYQRVSPCSMDL